MHSAATHGGRASTQLNRCYYCKTNKVTPRRQPPTQQPGREHPPWRPSCFTGLVMVGRLRAATGARAVPSCRM
jgi:hypothetical protein